MSERIAYILKGFPRASETFISAEIRLLTQMGLSLGLFSIKGGDEDIDVHDLPEVTYAPSVTALSGTGLGRWLWGNGALFRSSQRTLLRTHPRRYVKTLAFALGAAFRYRRWSGSLLKKTFIKEFLLATFFAERVLKAGTYTHLHAHFCHDATNVAWMVGLLTGLPFSFTAHAKDIYQDRLNPGDLLERKLAKTAFVVTCTEANVRYLRSKTLRPETIFGIYHGLDTGLFTPRPAQPDTALPRVLSVGRHVEKKGFIYLLQACTLLRWRGVEFRLDIIGPQGESTASLERYIADHDLEGTVRLLPPMRHQDLVHEYHSSELFVLPCVVMADGDRDGIPNVMAEAMASGLPVVVSEISGIPELVTHNESGVLVPERDIGALAEAIERVLADRSLGSRLGAEARRRIEKDFDATKTQQVLASLFRRQTLKEDCASWEGDRVRVA